jgi:hypothetical protein
MKSEAPAPKPLIPSSVMPTFTKPNKGGAAAVMKIQKWASPQFRQWPKSDWAGNLGADRMRREWFCWIVFCALVATLGCRAPSPDWNGTWKLNLSKSSYQGSVLTISISADGEYRFDESSSHTLRCDGKDRPIGNNRTLVCVKSGVTVLDITLKENGVKKKATRDEVSTDGKVFTTTVTEFRPNGPVITSQIVFSRLSGSNDFAGQWRDTSYLQQHADMTLRLDNQTLHIDYPSVGGEHIDAPLDGVEAAVHGPHAPEGTTYAVRFAGRRKFLTVTKRQGKVFNQGSLELSKDGRTITNSWWDPDRPADKGTLVYEKE